jgi:hypothetical protein
MIATLMKLENDKKKMYLLAAVSLLMMKEIPK